MGTVYLATRNGEVAAVKVISNGLAADRGFRARFHREVDLCRRVYGPNVAQVIDADVDADGATPWVAMQYVEGPTLNERVQTDGPFAEDDLEQLAVGTAFALQAMHRVGVIHRDLKPSNVIVTANGPIVIDFGVATAAEATTLTATGTVVGSAGWMAPEQVTGATVGPPADVFSWGATVAFAATGRPPYGVGRPEAVAYRVVHEQPDLDGFAGPLSELVRESLRREPDDRPLVSDLLAPRHEWGTVATVADEDLLGPETTLVGSAATITQVSRSPGESPPPEGRKRRWLPMAAAAAAALAIAAFGVMTWTSGDDAETSADPTDGRPPSTSAPPAPESSTTSTSEVPPTSSVAATATATAEETNMVTVEGADPPPLPVSLDGWAPIGSAERTEVRVFDTEPYSIDPAIGPSFNSCSDGFWTARWRSANSPIPLRVAIGYSAVVDPVSAEWTNEPLPSDSPTGTAGYASGFICQTPQFGWVNDGGTGSTLVDVIIEWQAWEPAV